jgi:hypothetical protein
MGQISSEFHNAILKAIDLLSQVPDDAIQYLVNGMPDTVTLYGDPTASPSQAAAGGCAHCTYLGLWADAWPGHKIGKHGAIWLFENGIRQMGQGQYDDLVAWDGRPLKGTAQAPDQLTSNTYEVLLHELGHALNRDHVLDEVERLRAQGYSSPSSARGCGVCPGRSWS